MITPSKTLFYLCISFVLGIAASSIAKIPQIFIWGILISGLLIIIISFTLRKNSFFVLGFCIFSLALGILRFQITEFTIANDPLHKFRDTPQKITLVGQIIDGPDVRDTSQKLKVKIDYAKSVVLVTTSRYADYHYLDKVKITGKLKTPMVAEDFNYKNYLLKDGIYSVMDFPKIQFVSTNHHYNIFTFSYEKILFFKEQLTTSLTTYFTPPHRLILEGIVLGDNTHMTQDLRNKLNASGLRYLTAISGVHVVILSAVLMSFLLLLGFWRGQAFYVTVVFIWLYVILTGCSASGVRAAMMGSLLLLAQKLGRQYTNSRALTMAATIMLLQNPLLLLYDVGFQLSFLASLGIIYIKPIVAWLLKIIAKERLKNAADIISATLSAQIITLPIMVYNFGNISLVAPITNLLVIPFVPWLMIVGFLMAVLGIFSHLLGVILSVPCWFLTTYFLEILDIFYQPWAAKTISNISWIWLIVYYAILATLILYFQELQKPEFLG